MLLLNGTLCDHSGTAQAHLRIQDGIITHISPDLTPMQGEEVLDCSGKFILPALIDIGIYPKNKSLSTNALKNLARKCLSGGVGTILLYGDSHPQTNTESIIELINLINLHTPITTLSSIQPFDEKGAIANIASLKNLGASAIHIHSQALEGQNLLTLTHYANMLNIPFISLPHDSALSQGVVDEGLLATRLGLPSIPAIAWEKEIIKMAGISASTQTSMLLTLTQGFEEVAFFNSKGAKVMTQTPIHHLILDENLYEGYSTKAKMFPPLKSQEKRQALQNALKSGQIQCLTSLQNATYNSKKDEVFELASCGVDVINHYFSLLYTHFVKTNLLTLPTLLTLTAKNQATLLHLKKGSLQVDFDADIIIADLDSSFTCQDVYSPYHGQKLFGKIESTLLKGQLHQGHTHD